MSDRGLFGQTLLELRTEQRVTQLALALASGSPGSEYICRLERGRRNNPSAQFVGRLLMGFAEVDRPLSPTQRQRLFRAALRIEELPEAS